MKIGRSLVQLHPLEPRRLFAALALADYFPAKAGYTWNYSGTSNSAQASDSRSVHADNTSGATVRFDDDTSVSGKSQTISDYYDVDKNGVFLVRQDKLADVVGGGSIVFNAPLHFLNPTLTVGAVLSWKNSPISATVNSAQDIVTTVAGSDSGSSSVVGFKQISLNNGKFVSALKVVLDHTESYSLSNQGVTVNVSTHIVQTTFLAFGIGVVESDDSVKQTQTAKGQTESASESSSLVLDSSPLLPDFTALIDGNGILTVTGTTGRDDLSVIAAHKQITVSNGAPSLSFNPATIKGISVSALDGNDHVTINTGALGAYVDGGTGNDSLVGGDGNDTLTGGAGKDTLYGGNGDDRLNGNGSNNFLFGEAGNDRLYGGDNDDQLDGGGGVDRLFAGEGNDILIGGGGNDKLYGQDGNDTLYGGAGADLLDGGAGKDKAQIDDADTRTSIATLFA